MGKRLKFPPRDGSIKAGTNGARPVLSKVPGAVEHSLKIPAGSNAVLNIRLYETANAACAREVNALMAQARPLLDRIAEIRQDMEAAWAPVAESIEREFSETLCGRKIPGRSDPSLQIAARKGGGLELVWEGPPLAVDATIAPAPTNSDETSVVVAGEPTG